MAGLKVVPVKSLPDGSLDLVDLKAKAEKYKNNLAAFMVGRYREFLPALADQHWQITYPSTFGVFEDGVQDACKIIHENGGQVYLDGMCEYHYARHELTIEQAPISMHK
jgi:glycine dehydrogenase